jgi:OOP family OmpA-OmpF porin
MHIPQSIILPATLAGIALILTGCNSQSDGSERPGDSETPTTAVEAIEDTEETEPPEAEQVSILRPEIDPTGQAAATLLEPLAVRVPFPAGGAELGEAALSALRQVANSEQIETDARIILRAHSDASGSDAVNLAVSQERGEAVKDWLVDQGVAANRIDVIAFGEQNPAQPNARPDGTPDEAGRAANRRVDITITPPRPDQARPGSSEAAAAPARR